MPELLLSMMYDLSLPERSIFLLDESRQPKTYHDFYLYDPFSLVSKTESLSL